MLRKTLKNLKGKITQEQKEAIRSTPFYDIGAFEVLKSSKTRLKALTECYNPLTMSFEFGKGISLRFEAREFSVVMGLHFRGQYVNPDLVEQPSPIVRRYFLGSFGNVTRKNIVSALGRIAGTEHSDVVNFSF